MKQTILSSKKVYRIWRPGWQVGRHHVYCSSPFIYYYFLIGINLEAPPSPSVGLVGCVGIVTDS